MNCVYMDLEVFQRRKKKRHENPQLSKKLNQFLTVKGTLMEMYLIHLEHANKNLVPLDNLSNCNCQPCQNKKITFLVRFNIYW